MWVKNFTKDLKIPFQIQKNQLCWFNCNYHYFPKNKFPIFICEYEHDKYFYGFPNFGNGIKVGLHKRGEFISDPDKPNRDLDNNLVEELRTVLKKYMNEIGNAKIT